MSGFLPCITWSGVPSRLGGGGRGGGAGGRKKQINTHILYENIKALLHGAKEQALPVRSIKPKPTPSTGKTAHNRYLP